jgi:serine/threonine-protein kinase
VEDRAVPRVSRQTFLSNLEACGLLEPGKLRAVLPKLPVTERGRVIARYLVEEGLLTRFQAENLLAGRTSGFVLGQYRILDEVGRGGMGRVFKAEHVTMRRVVALKVLAANLTRTERARQLFQREVWAAAKLVHPHIVTAFDAHQSGDRFFLVLEYIDGPNLSALVREQGALPVGQACEFVRQAALGLQHAHDLGLVHRDVKPSNLLVQPPVGRGLDQGGVVKIADFGLARLGAAGGDDPAAAAVNVVMGTPDFLSPEQGRDLNAVDIRADLYSLGCTLYYLLTGEVPFPGGTPLEKLTRHATAEPEPVELLRPVVPPGVVEVVRRLMAKRPEDRFQTPDALAAALDPFAEVRPVTWTPHREVPLASTGSVNLLDAPEGTPGTSILSGTQALTAGQASTITEDEGRKLSEDELRVLRGRPAKDWRWLRWMLFLLAAALGFALGAWIIASSLPGE